MLVTLVVQWLDSDGSGGDRMTTDCECQRCPYHQFRYMLERVSHELNTLGFMARVEYPEYILVDDDWAIGTANGTWGGNRQDCIACDCSFNTQLSSLNTNAILIANTIKSHILVGNIQ